MFDVVCVMGERTPLPRSVIGRLPQLKLIASTGPRNAAIDVEAAAERGIVVAHTGYDARPAIEMTWALILASARQVISMVWRAGVRAAYRRYCNDIDDASRGWFCRIRGR